MLSTLLALLGVFLFVMGIWLVSYYNMKRRRKSYIHEKIREDSEGKRLE